MATLYQKLGGCPAMTAAVGKFYENMLGCPEVKHFFQKTDLLKQKSQQIKFFSMVTGGPAEYDGADMRTAHTGMKITERQFDVTWEHLKTALLGLGVKEELIQELRHIFYSVRGDIVGV